VVDGVAEGLANAPVEFEGGGEAGVTELMEDLLEEFGSLESSVDCGVF